MNKTLTAPIAGVAVAIAITTTMDATGYSMLSALPLLPLTALFWYLQKFSREEIGLVWGNLRDYGLALAYPAFVLGDYGRHRVPGRCRKHRRCGVGQGGHEHDHDEYRWHRHGSDH